MDTTTVLLAKRIEARRLDAEMPLSTLAREIGMPRNTLRRRLDGYEDFTLPQLIAIARVLDTQLSVLTKGLAA